MGHFAVYNMSPNTNLADASATFSDWAIVGQDIEEAIREYEYKD